jgi:hypothetical protein
VISDNYTSRLYCLKTVPLMSEDFSS